MEKGRWRNTDSPWLMASNDHLKLLWTPPQKGTYDPNLTHGEVIIF